MILPGRRDLLALAAAFPERYPGLLESAADGTAHARHDILFAFPHSSLQLDRHGCVRDSAGEVVGSGFLEALDTAWKQSSRARTESTDGLPFHGGWLVYLSYELAGEIEPRLQLHSTEGLLPVALAVHCPVAVIVDHESDQTFLIAEPGFSHLLDQVESDLVECLPVAAQPLEVESIEEDDPAVFVRAVARTHEYLRDGDVFQVNLSREWRIGLASDTSPAVIYAHLRVANPAPFAALFQWESWAVVSSSPERLVQIRGNKVQTRPIAGTRPRLPGEDSAARIRELVGHPKERAEHVMLIDLERNDLGRVCIPGTVIVDELMGVESYAHVHHLVSNVSGELRPRTTPGQVIRAVFPGGTITGCPKVRCMEIIAELEPSARGAFTGAVGYLDNNGDLDLNILIRTLAVEGKRISLRAGAGIVIDSIAESEVAETRDKARGLLRAFNIDG
ncbi:aminodeoxychorismate synthase component I [Dokdonella sp.]|uniref:aminodeoxychorismate synthase component I n=1 Tax=Dokdonella sp. TaxID=2291710 RepID=UPI003C5C7A6D